jgi:hypothetical protein
MAKKNTENKPPKTIVLTRKQVFDMAAVANHFSDVELFTIEETNTSGIGPSVHVKCTLFQKPTTVDITDVENW